MSKTAKRTRRHPVMRVVCLMLFAVLLALVAPAGAQATWGAPETLSDASQNANFPQVAVDPNGDAVFVWQHYDGTTDCGGYACRRVESRYRSAAGVLSATDTLSGPATNTFYPPKVGVDSNGNAVFAWVSRDETTDCGRGYGCLRIRVRARSAAGVLSATQTVSERGAGASLPDIAVDTNGDAVVVWIRAGLIQARARSAAGTLSAVQTLSDSGGFPNFPEVGIDQTGNAVFAWQRYDGTTKCGGGPGCQRVQARTRSAAGALSAIQTLSDSGQDAQDAQVAVDPNGNAVFAWQRPGGGTNCGGFPGCVFIQGRALSAGGVLSSVQTLSAAGQSAAEPRVGIDQDGNAVFSWARNDGTTGCGGYGCSLAQARARSSAGTLSTVQTLSDAGQHANQPRIAVDPSGNAVFVWTRNDGTTGCGGYGCVVVQSRGRAADGTLSATQTLSAAGHNPDQTGVGVDSSGHAVAVWRSGGWPAYNDYVIQAAAGP